MRVSREWSRYDTIGGVLVLGILAAIVLPQFTDCYDPARVREIETRLQTIRSQIDLYNIRNPEAPFDATTPVGPAFWDPLVSHDRLRAPMGNPLQNNSTVVGATPAMGTGWVWAPWADMVNADDGSPRYVLQGVDETGNLYDPDEDGLPN